MRMISAHALNDNGFRLQAREPSLNQLELQSVSALIRYVADEQRAEMDKVCAIVETAFSIENVAALPRDNYDAAIRFLVDLRINERLN